MHSLLGEPYELWLDNEKISTAVKHRLIEHTCGQATRDYWSNKSRFRGMDIESIDWPTIHSVVTGMMIKQWRWTTKFTTGFCTTGQIMQWWGQRELVACPRCNHKTETMGHILQCPNTTAWQIRDRNIKGLQEILKDLETDLNTIEDLSKGFTRWSYEQPPPPMLTNASHLQTFILWDNFSHGLSQVVGRRSNNSIMTINNSDGQAQNGLQKYSNRYSSTPDNNGTIVMMNFTANNQTK